MINNIEQIKNMFYFTKEDNMFFHCQIVQRAKDHKGEKVRESAIKTYFLTSKEHLDLLMPEIVLLCEHYKARAYVNVAGKDFSSLQSLMLVKIANDIHNGLVRNPRKCLNSAAGELKSKNPKWIVDIDDMSIKDAIKEKLIELYREAFKTENVDEYIYAEIPTKQGAHLIVRPFNLKAFKDSFPNVDVHKNSMGTLLYFPESLS